MHFIINEVLTTGNNFQASVVWRHDCRKSSPMTSSTRFCSSSHSGKRTVLGTEDVSL